MYYAIHKLHWSPSEIEQFLDSESEVKAFYYACMEIKAENDKKEADRMKKESRKGKRK